MPRRIRKVLLALLVVFVLTVLAVLVTFAKRTPPLPSWPNPNGYDDFVKAGQAMKGKVWEFADLDHDSLAVLVSTNAESLRLLRVGLTRQSANPVDSRLAIAPGAEKPLGAMRHLIQLLAAEGRLGEIESRPADAARSYTDAIRFGNEMSRGGSLLDRLVGMASESVGYQGLVRLAQKLGHQDVRTVLTELEKVELGRVSWVEVQGVERHYRNQFMRQDPIAWARTWWEMRQATQRAETKHKLVMAHERLLAAEFALRLCQAEQVRVPVSLDDLATNYLSRVPQDPFSGKPMIYRPQGTNWLLYSIGPDGVDDGGKRISRNVPGTVPKGDLFYDSTY